MGKPVEVRRCPATVGRASPRRRAHVTTGKLFEPGYLANRPEPLKPSRAREAPGASAASRSPPTPGRPDHRSWPPSRARRTTRPGVSWTTVVTNQARGRQERSERRRHRSRRLSDRRRPTRDSRDGVISRPSARRSPRMPPRSPRSCGSRPHLRVRTANGCSRTWSRLATAPTAKRRGRQRRDCLGSVRRMLLCMPPSLPLRPRECG